MSDWWYAIVSLDVAMAQLVIGWWQMDCCDFLAIDQQQPWMNVMDVWWMEKKAADDRQAEKN